MVALAGVCGFMGQDGPSLLVGERAQCSRADDHASLPSWQVVRSGYGVVQHQRGPAGVGLGDQPQQLTMPRPLPRTLQRVAQLAKQHPASERQPSGHSGDVPARQPVRCGAVRQNAAYGRRARCRSAVRPKAMVC